jgi:vitamin B12 transporter
MKFFRYALTIIAITPVCRIDAQTRDTATLNAMVISATRTPSSKASLTQSVTVLSGEDLRAKGITRVSDALRLVPGVNLVQNGSAGSVNTLFLRGGESRYTKVLIDNVAVNAPGGFFDFSHLTTDNIERIEVVRGPASVVYGADAMTGIVRIFTRQGRGRLNVNADARAGKYATREASVEMNGASDRIRYSAGGGAHRTDGILPFNNQYYNGTLSSSLGVKPRDGSDLVLTARYTNAEFHYPTDFTGAPVDSNSYRVQHRLTVGLDANHQFARAIKGSVALGTNEVSDMTEDIGIPFGSSTKSRSRDFSRNKRRAADANISFGLPSSTTLTVGGAYEKEREGSVSSSGPQGAGLTPTSRFNASRHNTAVYSELISNGKTGGSLTLAARRDDNSDYDAFTAYRAGVSLPAGTSSRLRASVSTAFNAPAFNQVRPTLYTVGSPGLKPERARSWEIGLEETLADGTMKVSASYFNQRFSDLIQYVNGVSPTFLGSYANLARAESNGYEAEVTLTPAGEWSGSASYTVAKPRVTRVDAAYTGSLKTGDPLIRRPKQSGTATLTWTRPRSASLGIIANYVGERPDFDFNQFPSPTVTLPEYTKLDIAGTKNIFQGESGKTSLAVTFRVDNVLDRKYEDVLHYAAPRRTYLVGARLSGAM